jgi:hypothetical protein
MRIAQELGATEMAVRSKCDRLDITLGVGRIHRAGWSAAMVDRLRALADGTRSALQIGEALGISRKAVIGKCRRMGIALRSPRVATTARPRGERGQLLPAGVPAPQRVEKAASEAPRPAPRPVVVPPPPPAPALVCEGVSLFDLPANGCRWPVAASLYCGAPKVPGRSYCSVHRAVSAAPAKSAGQRIVIERSARTGLYA